MFKVGDRVVGTLELGYYSDDYVGEVGKIVEVDPRDTFVYFVEFDNKALGKIWVDADDVESAPPSHLTDPKQSQGAKKLGFSHIPITAYCLLSASTKNGADKYGPHNWLELPDGNMSLMTYIDAIQRHLLLYKAGQDVASDSGIHHLDHIMAGVAVVRDAMLFGKVADDRIRLSEEQIEVLENLISTDKSM